MLLDVETDNPISKDEELYAIGHPTCLQISGLSETTFRRVEGRWLPYDSKIQVGPDELVIYEGISTEKNGFYTVNGFREGRPLYVIPAQEAADKFPRAWMHYRKKASNRENEVVYTYAAVDGQTWYGNAETREEAVEIGMEHFGGDEIRTRKEYRTYTDEQVHRRKDVERSTRTNEG